ncbi:MAG: hypothetical protein AB7K09_05815 [Planctomycetota bacterium]
MRIRLQADAQKLRSFDEYTKDVAVHRAARTAALLKLLSNE